MMKVSLTRDWPDVHHGRQESLRVWLADRWAILFSHPVDFTAEELEIDRWISVLSRSFSASRVAPLALAGPGRDNEHGWLGRLAAPGAAMLTLDPPRDAPADLAAAALGAHIASSGPRFVMILNSSLRCRRTLSYRSRAGLPSPLEVLGWAVSLRKRDRIEQTAAGTPEALAGEERRPDLQSGRRPLVLAGRAASQ